MLKKYIVSLDANLQSFEQARVQKEMEALNVNIVNTFAQLGVMAVEVADDDVVHQLKKIRGILAVEDDISMTTQQDG